MRAGLWIMLAVMGLGAAGGAWAMVSRGCQLKGEDLVAVRAEALGLFPRGSRVADANRALTDRGFQCYPIEHNFPNVNGPSLTCNSNGRNFPVSPGLSITISGRNGIVSEIEVWNLFGDARQSPPVSTANRL